MIVTEPAAPRDRGLLIFVAFAIAIILAHVLDPWAFRALRMEGVYSGDLGRLLRVQGFLPTWIAVGLALALHDPERGWRVLRGRGGLLVASAAAGGIVAEGLKLVFRRLRPGELGEYVFRPFTERPFHSGGLGLPSSHALVAFGAAAMLSRLFPRARVLWWTLAWGCGLSRIAAGAHFLSDVVVAAGLGWLMGALLWRARGEDAVPARTRRRKSLHAIS